MKIKVSDNFARENISDRLVCENIDEYHGNLIVKFLNSREGNNGSNFYSLESDDHKLYIWEP
jgi:hypothetical protein